MLCTGCALITSLQPLKIAAQRPGSQSGDETRQGIHSLRDLETVGEFGAANIQGTARQRKKECYGILLYHRGNGYAFTWINLLD
jgi:hypothetical protein